MFIHDRVVPRSVLAAKERSCLAKFEFLPLENGPCHVLEDGQTTVLNPFR